LACQVQDAPASHALASADDLASAALAAWDGAQSVRQASAWLPRARDKPGAVQSAEQSCDANPRLAALAAWRARQSKAALRQPAAALSKLALAPALAERRPERPQPAEALLLELKAAERDVQAFPRQAARRRHGSVPRISRAQRE